MQSDPIGLAGGINTYAYVNGSPFRLIDPMGLFGWGDVDTGWGHYCDGSGTPWTANFDSINWGDTEGKIHSKIGQMARGPCTERSIPVNLSYGAQTAGADAYIIGRHVVKVAGTIKMYCDCSWTFFGDMSSLLGYDPFDFNPSNRGVVGEALTWIGTKRCPNTGKPFNIHLPGNRGMVFSGKTSGTPTCCGV